MQCSLCCTKCWCGKNDGVIVAHVLVSKFDLQVLKHDTPVLPVRPIIGQISEIWSISYSGSKICPKFWELF